MAGFRNGDNSVNYRAVAMASWAFMLAGLPVVATITCGYIKAIEAKAEDNAQKIQQNREEIVRRETVIKQIPEIAAKVNTIQQNQAVQNRLLQDIADAVKTRDRK